MNRRISYIFAFSLMVALSGVGQAGSPAKVAELCPRVTLEGEFDPELTAMEKRLICGDPEISDGWRDIPLNQAEYNLRSFLQQRGYLHPAVTKTANHIHFSIGAPTLVTSLDADGAPESLRLGRKRKVVGERLTPTLLGEVEKWVAERLQAEGYACPEVTSHANPDTGALVVHVKPGEVQNLVMVHQESVPGLADRILGRYDAFQFDVPYNGDWMAVTETRIATENLLDATHFAATCTPQGVVSHQTVVAGPPRLLVFGVGIDTEGLINAKASWRHTRLGRFASWADATALASTKDQKIDLTVNWYRSPSRISLRPAAELRHQNEEHFESVSSRLQLGPQTTWDGQRLGAYALFFGPVFETYRTLRGTDVANARDTHFLSLGGDVKLRTHEFEYFFKSPRTGYNVTFSANINDQDILSDATAERFEIRGEALWNYRDYDPPLWVFGWRGGVATILTPERPGPTNRLPPAFLKYLGGADDLRGFGRQELPNGGPGTQGGLTSFFTDFEVRLSNTLPAGLDPFLFYDIGALGNGPAQFASPVFTSPGFGMRWASPIGVVRTTLAHGYPSPSHFQFFFSYGEEF